MNYNRNPFTLVKKINILYVVCDRKLFANYLWETYCKLAISNHFSKGWEACTIPSVNVLIVTIIYHY